MLREAAAYVSLLYGLNSFGFSGVERLAWGEFEAVISSPWLCGLIGLGANLSDPGLSEVECGELGLWWSCGGVCVFGMLRAGP